MARWQPSDEPQLKSKALGAPNGGQSSKLISLSWENQVHLVLKLLGRNGEHSAKMVRKRAEKGEGVVAKGLEFDVTVLKEALRRWDMSRQGSGAIQEMPTPSAISKGSDIPPAATSTMKNQDNAHISAFGLSSAPDGQVIRSPKRRLSRKSSVSSPNENRDPQSTDGSSGPASKRDKKASPGSRPRSPVTLKANVSPPERIHVSPGSNDAGRSEPIYQDGISKTVKELKCLLEAKGIDFATCVEKADLEALWAKFEMWTKRPLAELQALSEETGGRSFSTVEDCARFLCLSHGKVAKQIPAERTATPQSTSTCTPTAPARPVLSANKPPVEAGITESDIQREVSRILPLRRESFGSVALWGFKVLEVSPSLQDMSAVQRAYRALMRKLHPDRAGGFAEAAKAVEMVREAKEACERSLSKQEPPSVPRFLRSEMLCATAGHRQIKLCWNAPPERASAPVRRYIVAAFDPAYGKALTITVLEPDYSEDLRRFVSVDELTSHVLAEEDLQKMPQLWRQSYATLQVAAANEAGQSQWATLQVPLNKDISSAKQSFAQGKLADTENQRNRIGGETEDRAFHLQVQQLRGEQLRSWLNSQSKGSLGNWLKRMNWSASGAKQDLVERIVFIREAMCF